MTPGAAKRHLADAIQSMGKAELIEVILDHALMRLQCIRDLGPDAPWEELRPHLVGCQKAVGLLLEGVVPPHAKVDAGVQDLASRLRTLYVWVIGELVQSDVKRRRPNVDALERVLNDISQGWKIGVLGRG